MHCRVQDHFTFLEIIGRGAFAKVYKAKKHHTNELVAIKALFVEAYAQKSHQEVRLMMECDHENLIKFHGAYLQEHGKKTLFIAMEFCGGGSLPNIYKDLGAFKEDETAFVCREVLQGLQFLHCNGILHRDIKGDNVLVNDAGDVKICDLGLAARSTDSIATLKSSGTLNWMAPEVICAKMNGGYDEKCDIWSLGMMAAEVAKAEVPFRNMSCSWIFANNTFAFWDLKEVYWSREFKDFVFKALIPDPGTRPSAKELLMHPFVNRPQLTPSVIENLLEKRKNRMLGGSFPAQPEQEEEKQDLGKEQGLHEEPMPVSEEEQQSMYQEAKPEGPSSKKCSCRRDQALRRVPAFFRRVFKHLCCCRCRGISE
ncbi:mitogen-activated protein kinase kinase kinase kinase 5-like isoform X2 [Denticeps clupeoides]|uniref:mitogen-activated protein kinase kinase kinase kinase 5-like isoform X2 n=1 Tax=Denticeps clupeoides TaxID=299321 RepID=UPI0010A53BB7|nr:mitogen-activated protein kinase kinase kinase kinase 5-like isoform X2 [Denticeps clupeoides]